MPSAANKKNSSFESAAASARSEIFIDLIPTNINNNKNANSNNTNENYNTNSKSGSGTGSYNITFSSSKLSTESLKQTQFQHLDRFQATSSNNNSNNNEENACNSTRSSSSSSCSKYLMIEHDNSSSSTTSRSSYDSVANNRSSPTPNTNLEIGENNNEGLSSFRLHAQLSQTSSKNNRRDQDKNSSKLFYQSQKEKKIFFL